MYLRYSLRVVVPMHRVPFWLATGYGEMENRLAELGASGLLTKPYGKDELVEMLTQAGQD